MQTLTKESCGGYRINLKYSNRQTCVNGVDPDQTAQNTVSDQGIHCLSYIQYIVDK